MFSRGAIAEAANSVSTVVARLRYRITELEDALNAAEALLRPGGRLAVVSFHSLEDRIVKQFLRDASGGAAAVSRHLPPAASTFEPTFAAVGKAVRPSPAEVARNPRSRSATLRSATRTEAPARERKAA